MGIEGAKKVKLRGPKRSSLVQHTVDSLVVTVVGCHTKVITFSVQEGGSFVGQTCDLSGNQILNNNHVSRRRLWN